MSWETFKQNILRVANSPEGISDINVVAELYAKEYDAAVKRGFDIQHKIRLVNGNVEMMKQLFISALQKGVNSPVPYDLVGEMGEGVKAYWAGAVMATTPLPITPAIQATANISVTQNIVTNPGIWQKPISGVSPISEELTPEKRIEYQEGLETELEKYTKFLEENRKQEELATVTDAINKFTSLLEENKDYNTEVSLADALLGIVPGQPISTTSVTTTPVTTTPVTTTPVTTTPVTTTPTPTPTQPPTTPTESTPTELTDEELAEFLKGPQVGGLDSGDVVTAFQFNQGKPFVSGFKIGGGGGPGGGGGSFNGSYVKFNNFAGNASLGERAVQVGLHDVSQGVQEGPDDTGHPRIAEMHKNGGVGDRNPWCACAVTTWWLEAGYVFKGHPNKAYCPTWEAWSKENGSWVDMVNPENAKFVPKPGDAIIYDWAGTNGAANHIGLFWKIENGFWWGIDGNKGARGKAAVKSHCIKSLGAVRGIIRI